MRPTLRMVEPDNEHTRDIARRRVKEYVDRQEPKPPITNQHGPEETRAPRLDVDEILKKAEQDHIGKKA